MSMGQQPQSYDLNNLRRELDKARTLFPPKSAVTPPPPRPVWSESSSGLRPSSPPGGALCSVSPSPWQAVPLGEGYKSAEPLDMSGMASDCGEMESVFARNVDWERVARILAEKLEVAVQETAAMKEERDLSAAQLRRLEKIVETHATAAATCASQLKSYRGNQKSLGTQTLQKGSTLGEQQSELAALREEKEQLCNTLKGVTTDYEKTLEELWAAQLELANKIELDEAAHSNTTTKLNARQREANRELAESQTELLELKQMNKKLKKQLAWFRGGSKDGAKAES